MIFIKVKLVVFLIFVSLFIVAQEEQKKPDWLNTSSFSFEELNYSTCKITAYESQNYELLNKEKVSFENLPLEPGVMGTRLKKLMCDTAEMRCRSGRPPSLGCQDYTREMVDGEWVYTLNTNHKELDFDNEVIKFLEEYQSQLPSCTADKKFDNCFGQGIVWNGLYVGEWENNKPNGKGIQLITRDVPFNFNNEVWNSIYKGSFKDGMFHGAGKFFNLEESFDGEWFMGEMHGHIEWEWPVIYRFGFSFERNDKGIIVTNVDPYSPAEDAGLKVGIVIESIKTADNEIITSETGLVSIANLLSELDRDELITLAILDPTAEIKNEVYSFCNDNNADRNSCFNKVEQACQNLIDKEAVKTRSECYEAFQTLEMIKPSYTLSFSKSQTNLKDQSTFFCMDNRNEKCYEESKLKNTLIKKGKLSKGSFFMGTKHAYTNDDLYVYIESDGSMRWDKLCHDKAPPYSVLTKDKEILKRIKFVTPSVFIYENEYNSPCADRLGSDPEIFYFPHVLKESPQDLDLIAETTGLFKIDILDYLDNFIIKLDEANLPFNIQSTIHEWCNIAVIRSKYCNANYENTIASYMQRKTLDNPKTLGHQRKKDLQLLRAEANYLTLAYCKAKNPISIWNYENLFFECLADILSWEVSFWDCIYSGKEMSRCNQGINRIHLREKFKADNPDLLKDVDLSEWVFGDL